MSADCLFCRIVAGELPAERIYENSQTLAFLDIAPGSEGHALVIPKRHAADLHALTDDDLTACAFTARRVASMAREALGARGVSLWQANGPLAGQTVFHYHVHVIPRWEGDGVHVPWQPAPADPEALAELGRRYRETR